MGLLMTWREELGAGCPEIDRQHRELIDMAAGVHAAISGGSPAAEVEKLLVSLVDHTRRHFISEEGLMLASGYPGYDEHKRDHARLLDRLATITQQVKQGHSEVSGALAGLVRTLTEQHILFSDKHLAAFLVENGFGV